MKKKYIVTLVLLVLVIGLGIISYVRGNNREDLVYRDNLDKVVLTVDGADLTLKDLAFYIAYEEKEVEELAKVYDESDTKKYWNLHIDGVFVKLSAKSAIIQMAVHDEIFYQLALEMELCLNEEEKAKLDISTEDFWNDLSDYDRTMKLGVDKEDISLQMEKIALAEKYQMILAGMNGYEYEDYAFSKEAYQEVLKEHKYKVKESVWNRIPIGDVTLEHD